jgi:hypothetical protein
MENIKQDLISTLKKASSNFKEGSPLGIDLRTAALALESMSKEAFEAHVASDASMINPASEQVEEEIKESKQEEVRSEEACGKYAEEESDEETATNGDDEAMKKQADINWNKYASTVSDHLVRSIVAGNLNNDASKERGEGLPEAALPKEQLPNGEGNEGVQTDRGEPVAEAALAPEQTPNQAEVLESDAENKTEEKPAAKKASEESEEESEEKEAAVEVKEETTEEPEEAEEKEASEESEEETEKEATIIGEGVELFAAMDDIEGASISAADQSMLDELYK